MSAKQSGVAIKDMASELSPQDWPSWRGSQHDGVVRDAASIPGDGFQWPESAKVIWTSDVPGRGHSSPIVVGDAVYLATALDEEQQQRVLCFDRETGEVRFDKLIHQGNFPTDREVHKKATNANSTIASDGKRLYVTFFNSQSIFATALDMNGEEVWQTKVGMFVSRFGYAPSPILYQSLVIVSADNSGGGYIAALDTETGEVAWRIKRGDTDSYSSPTVANVGGRDQLLISGDGAVTSYDPATGELLWRTACISKATCGTVIAADERIFASGGFPDEETVCLTADGERVWSNETKIYEPSLLSQGGFLVAVSDDGIGFCWDAATGELHWKKRIGGNFSASPVAIGDVALVPNLDGDLHVFRIGERFEQIAKYRIGVDSYTSAAIHRGDLLLRVGGENLAKRLERLVCVQLIGDNVGQPVLIE
ncbi:PQQ-binding-like beta-propeller repeat protein [Rubripirellula tenax]|uniref:PQQ-binding-like beta-propeller repeat protein n=1 Tax=Rubripirellula tenax TaxID=2528015 RepID=UPI001FE6311B|nr:PQQ-binding-like beta-propeller repeat protein [Rubripirellula tenax]